VEAEERTAPGELDVDRDAGARSDAPARERSVARTDEHYGRCAHHPARTAVDRCDRCGEPVCLACAVPVRGRVLGPGCIAEELGDPALMAPPEPDRPLAGPAIALAGAVVAVVATAGPWTRTGAGDRLLGAWVADLRWSMIAAIAAILLIPAWWRLRGRGRRSDAVAVTVLGGVVAAASILAIVFPPTFQAASWGPWAALGGAAVAATGGIVGLITEPHPGQGV
jgi:hypothetical protein